MHAEKQDKKFEEITIVNVDTLLLVPKLTTEMRLRFLFAVLLCIACLEMKTSSALSSFVLWDIGIKK